MNGEIPLELEGRHLIPSKTIGNADIQSCFLAMMAVLIEEWARSILPFVEGLKLAVRSLWNPTSCESSENNSDSNCPPLSLIRYNGTPNLEIHPCKKAYATDFAVIFIRGTASIQFVPLSMHVSRYL